MPMPCVDRAQCIYTDGSFLKPEPGSSPDDPDAKARAGAGVHHMHFERSMQVEGDVLNAHRAEVAALREAVKLAVQTDSQRHWHIYTDSLVSLYQLQRYRNDPDSLDANPVAAAMEDIASAVRDAQAVVTFHKVRAHANVTGNERADALAKQGATQATDGSTPNLPEYVDGVRITHITRNEDGDAERKILAFKKHYTNCFPKILFPAPTPSVWRQAKTDCTPMHKRVREGWSDAQEKTWFKALHAQTLTQQKAAAIAMPRKPKRKTESRGVRKLRRAMSRQPALSDKCPLCGGTDSWAHMLLWCKEEGIKKCRIKRHNKILGEVLTMVKQGKHGQEWVTGDMPGWSREDIKEQAEGGREVRPPVTPFLNFEPNPQYESGSDIDYAPSSEDEDTDSDTEAAQEPEESDVTRKERERKEAEEELKHLEDSEGEDFFEDDTETDGKPSRNIVPEEWKYSGSQRPDGLLIHKHPRGSKKSTRGKAIFFDVTVVSEQAVQQAIRKKRKSL